MSAERIAHVQASIDAALNDLAFNSAMPYHDLHTLVEAADAFMSTVRRLTDSPARRSASSPNLPGLSGGGDAVPSAASPVYDPEGEA